MENKNKEEPTKNTLTDAQKQGIEQRKKAIVELVMRQTNYTQEEAIEKLEEHKYNYLSVIKLYMNPENKQSSKPANANKTKNQMIYGEIRNFMDGVNKQYLYRKRQKEIFEKRKELFMSKLKEEHNRRISEQEITANASSETSKIGEANNTNENKIE